MTDLCLVGLLPSPHQGVGLGGNYCCRSQSLTCTQGIKVSSLFLFFSYLCSLRRSLVVKTHAGLSLMSHSRFPPSPRRLFEMTICGKFEDCCVFAGEFIPLWETKESSRFNLVAPPGRQLHKSGCLSQSVHGGKEKHVFTKRHRCYRELWQQQCW